ncbi:MAG: polyprenol monophosphomannose synthase [Planctomycetaceae bacterium]|nr:polyprenol monophosphomannose synthase [Planctomycetaceae bacterium]
MPSPSDQPSLSNSLSPPAGSGADLSIPLAGRRVLIVIATYNEIENLPKLLTRLRQLYPSVDALVIDDGSPDGTGDWVAEFSRSNSWCHLLSRSGKLGLGSATIAGFRWALDQAYTDVVTMDADFSHHPDELVRLLDSTPETEKHNIRIDEERCIVIGSRYVPEGRIEGWPWQRRWASRWINRLARWRLRLKTFDNSGAYRRYPVALLKQLPLDQIRNKGYGYLEEILYLAQRHGATFREVPITFRDRTQGQSKINLREACQALWTILTLPYKVGQ